MLNAYERQLVLSYLANAASRFHYTYQQEAHSAPASRPMRRS